MPSSTKVYISGIKCRILSSCSEANVFLSIFSSLLLKVTSAKSGKKENGKNERKRQEQIKVKTVRILCI